MPLISAEESRKIAEQVDINVNNERMMVYFWDNILMYIKAAREKGEYLTRFPFINSYNVQYNEEKVQKDIIKRLNKENYQAIFKGCPPDVKLRITW